MYAIRAVGMQRTCWLRYDPEKKRYYWHFGGPGRIRAARFETPAEAQAVIDSGYSGAAGVAAEVVELDERGRVADCS